MSTTDVMVAFDILLDSVEGEIEHTSEMGARAFASRDLDQVKTALEQAAQVMGMRDRIHGLRREWENLFVQEEAGGEPPESSRTRDFLGRLSPGSCTREDAYVLPILMAVKHLGGSAPTGQVLDLVLKSMQGVLKPADYQPISSTPDRPRWHHVARWARSTMVRDGLLLSNSPRGVWEISEAGRRCLIKETP